MQAVKTISRLGEVPCMVRKTVVLTDALLVCAMACVHPFRQSVNNAMSADADFLRFWAHIQTPQPWFSSRATKL
jgi:hypothetical protein